MGMFKDTNELIDKFISNGTDYKDDYLKRENSNFVFSLPLLRKNLCNRAEEEFLMTKILPRELVQAYENGIIYIHDKQLSSYCQSISCKDIAEKGIPSLAKNMIISQPASSLEILLRHFSNIVTLMSQQVSGAVMLAQMTTICASYLYEEHTQGKDYSNYQLKKMFKSLVYELNLPLRSGSESAFSNITLEFGKPSEDIKDELVIIGGNTLDYIYSEIPKVFFDKINQAIIDVMSMGDGRGIPFTFPLMTVQIDDEFKFDNELFLYMLDKMYNWGGVYFENFKQKPFDNEYYKKLNPYIKAKDPSVSKSLCCRLNINTETLAKIGGGIFGSSVGNVGAIQVLNLNLNRVLLEFYDITKPNCEEILFSKIREYFELMQQGHLAKRKFIETHKDLYPTFFSFNDNLKNYFNVFAVSGMHEGLINIGYKEGLNSTNGKFFAHKLMQYITTIIDDFIVRDKVACGLEFAPNENAGIKLARADVKWAKAHNKECFVQGSGKDVYTTSGCMLPFAEQDFLKQVENAAEFQGYATSGSILHHFLEDKIEPKKLADYINKLFNKPINYITLTPTLTSCMNCGQKIIGKDAKDVHNCPVCGSDDIATFSRVIGYVRMISRKNIKINNEGKYEGDYNFWSNARRIDWANRKKTKEIDLINKEE